MATAAQHKSQRLSSEMKVTFNNCMKFLHVCLLEFKDEQDSTSAEWKSIMGMLRYARSGQQPTAVWSTCHPSFPLPGTPVRFYRKAAIEIATPSAFALCTQRDETDPKIWRGKTGDFCSVGCLVPLCQVFRAMESTIYMYYCLRSL